MLPRQFLTQPFLGVAQALSKLPAIQNNCCTVRNFVSPGSFQKQQSSAESVSHNQSSNVKGSEDLPIWDMESPFKEYKQECILCKMGINPDFKNVKLLSQFVSRFTGKTYGRHITRLCRRQQEAVENEITKAQRAGLMATYFRDLHFTEDPKLFNPERPVRPHKY